MGVLKEEVEVSVDMHVDDDWSIVHDVVMQIFQILLSVSKFLDPLHQHSFFPVMQSFALVVHVYHRLILQIGAPVIGRVISS